MKKQNFEKFATDIIGKNVKILEPEDNTKYARYFGSFDELKPNKKYGVYFDEMIQYDFKTTSKVDSFCKTFVTQHINKYEMKQATGFENGSLTYPKKTECLERLRNSERVSKYFYYTTLYGIGMFAIMGENSFNKITGLMAEYLKDKGVEFNNEFSEAGWAYRFVIGMSVENHNELLEQFKI
jgi:hypothetical protein